MGGEENDKRMNCKMVGDTFFLMAWHALVAFAMLAN